jgi:hypothetical protein
MLFKPTWGREIGAMGWSCVLYAWVYEPLCQNLWHVEPWSLTTYGFVLFGLGVLLNIVQYLVYL